jgi:hypothetical protein
VTCRLRVKVKIDGNTSSYMIRQLVGATEFRSEC